MSDQNKNMLILFLITSSVWFIICAVMYLNYELRIEYMVEHCPRLNLITYE